jgi:hypothetical protein
LRFDAVPDAPRFTLTDGFVSSVGMVTLRPGAILMNVFGANDIDIGSALTGTDSLLDFRALSLIDNSRVSIDA